MRWKLMTVALAAWALAGFFTLKNRSDYEYMMAMSHYPHATWEHLTLLEELLRDPTRDTQGEDPSFALQLIRQEKLRRVRIPLTMCVATLATLAAIFPWRQRRKPPAS